MHCSTRLSRSQFACQLPQRVACTWVVCHCYCLRKFALIYATVAFLFANLNAAMQCGRVCCMQHCLCRIQRHCITFALCCRRLLPCCTALHIALLFLQVDNKYYSCPCWQRTQLFTRYICVYMQVYIATMLCCKVGGVFFSFSFTFSTFYGYYNLPNNFLSATTCHSLATSLFAASFA